jgi:ankyrin repeat protein
MAAQYCALRVIDALLLDGRLNLDAQNDYGETALHLVAALGDKSAIKVAKLLLQYGASLLVTDKWGRTPLDVSIDCGELHLVVVFEEHLKDTALCTEDQREEVRLRSLTYRQAIAVSTVDETAMNSRATMLASSLLKECTSMKLRPVETKIQNIFTCEKTVEVAETPAPAINSRKILSKLVEFPGSLDEIRGYLDDTEHVDPAGKDAYGLTALHKFASWNKCEYLDLLIPHLSREDLLMKCPMGKSALNYATESGAMAASALLVAIAFNIVDSSSSS